MDNIHVPVVGTVDGLTMANKVNDGFDSLQKNIGSALSKSVAGNVDVTLSGAEANNAIIMLTGALTGNINVIVPTSSFKWIFANSTSGAYTLTVKTAAGTGVAIPQGQAYPLYCDGTNVLSSALTKAYLDTLYLAIGGAISGTTIAGTDATDATSSTAAAMKTAGGLAVAKKAIIGALLDLSTATAGQIKFPAAQNASADANTLDDYEESDSWTPSIRGDTGGAWSGQTGTFEGTYTKKGREVTAHFRVALTNKGTPAGTYAFLAGLPFAAANKGCLGGTIYYFSGLAANWISLHGVLINGGDTTAYFYGRKAATAAAGSDLVAVTDIGNTTEIRGTVIYHI